MYESEKEVPKASFLISFSSDEYAHLLKESEHILAHLLTAQTLEDLKELKERYRVFSTLLKQKEPQKKREEKTDIQKEKIDELLSLLDDENRIKLMNFIKNKKKVIYEKEKKDSSVAA
jgi:hypothetical protein